MKYIKKQYGFTLLEILTTLSFFLIVILATGSMYSLAQRTYRAGIDQGELMQNARVCLDRMSRELRQAAGLITDISSTSTPVSEIFFQNGHDNTDITYIKYYLSSNSINRSHMAYFFAIDPTTYVYYDSVNGLGDSPTELIFEDRIVGEYFDNISFYGENGLVNIEADLKKNITNLDIGTKTYIRNW